MPTRSLNEAIKSIAGDTKLTDVVLEAKDEGGTSHEVPASKLILSVRSEVFKTMLYGTFIEGSSDKPKVKLDFKFRTVRSLVHYLYTDQIQTFSWNDNDVDDSSTSSSDMIDVEEYTDLYNAAHYFDIKCLLDDINKQFEDAWLRSNKWKNLNMPDSILYGACQVVDYSCDDNEDKDDGLIGFIKNLILMTFARDGFTSEMLEAYVSPPFISRFFNKWTITSGMGASCWLQLLEEWSQQSQEHTVAAKASIDKISKKIFDSSVIDNFYQKGSNIITKDFAFEVFREKALTFSHQEYHVKMYYTGRGEGNEAAKRQRTSYIIF